MRILLATDGSAQARVARDLLGSLAIPARSIVLVLGVVPAPSLAALSSAVRARLLDRAVGATIVDLERYARPLRKTDRAVTVAAKPGRAAQTIVSEARRMRADLIVVGSHGYGVLRDTLFGSVAAEVVEAAPCAVLVARTRRVSRVVVADDGSPVARRATRLLEAGLFGKPAVTVVSAWHVGIPISEPQDAAFEELVMREYERERRSVARAHARIADATAARLARAGLPAATAVAEGSATQEVLAAAKAKRADLIALGTRGRSALVSLVLGSVARGVLHGSHASLLIAPRRPAR